METTDTYLSISGRSEGNFRDRGSKFLGFAFPVSTENTVKEYLTALKKEYHNANHHCYAYRIGFPEGIFRINDDGEPSGSAGRPIFGQIQSHELYDILIVVIRFFGGTKLGMPGLIRAYKTTAWETIHSNTFVTKLLKERFRISFPYTQLNEVMRIIKQEEADIDEQVFDDRCSMNLSIRKSGCEKLNNLLLRLPDISICN